MKSFKDETQNKQGGLNQELKRSTIIFGLNSYHKCVCGYDFVLYGLVCNKSNNCYKEPISMFHIYKQTGNIEAKLAILHIYIRS